MMRKEKAHQGCEEEDVVEGGGEEEGVKEITMDVWNTVMVGMVAEDEAVVYGEEAEALVGSQ
ncbi:hypothetical protein HN51_036282 [Arachis hypogaea]